MLQTTGELTGDETQNTQAKKWDVSGGGRADGANSIDRDIKNLSSIVKSAKSIKPNFAKANSSKTDFLTFEAKKTFIYLQKAFMDALILKYFDP